MRNADAYDFTFTEGGAGRVKEARDLCPRELHRPRRPDVRSRNLARIRRQAGRNVDTQHAAVTFVQRFDNLCQLTLERPRQTAAEKCVDNQWAHMQGRSRELFG